MKTYEEALKVVLAKRDALSAEEYDLRIHRLNAYNDLVSDLRDNQDTLTLLNIIVEGIITQFVDLHTALFTAFVNGLIVGMEMEKQEPDA